MVAVVGVTATATLAALATVIAKTCAVPRSEESVT